MLSNSFGARATFKVGNKEYELYRLDALDDNGVATKHLPYSLRILLENLLRTEDGRNVTENDIRALAAWNSKSKPEKEIAFPPSRVLLQGFTGVPAVVDLAAMRDAMKRLSGDPTLINPLQPAELVIDHSVQVDEFGTPQAFQFNAELEFLRNKERYAFLRWGQTAFRNLAIVPPDTGIVHQVNLEYLARVVFVQESNGKRVAYPDTLVGTDSHTTMINGLGVLGWGVGGIEAEAAMLGQPTYLPWPVVVGVKLKGQLPVGTTATDLVLTLTELFRQKGGVNKFIEFTGDGLSSLAVAERATVSNMCPEYGATSALFPVDRQTLRYLEQTGRPKELIELVERYTKAQGMFRSDGDSTPTFDELVEVDLGSVHPSVSGPKRPQDRVDLPMIWDSFTGPKPTTGLPRPGETEGPKKVNDAAQTMVAPATAVTAAVAEKPRDLVVNDGSVVIAAITSCTNTSNPSVMIAAGLLAKKAIEKGLAVKPHVKTTFAPGSRVVTRYLDAAGLTPYFEQLGFYLVGFGCTVCIGNTGPLATPEIEQEVKDQDLNVVSVLSGNRNFEGRIHPLVKSSYLASPPLVVAYALAGTVHIDLQDQPIGNGKDGKPVFLKDLWPTPEEVNEVVGKAITKEMYATEYGKIFDGDRFWKTMPSPTGLSYQWDPNSTYVQEPPFFQNFSAERPAAIADIVNARVLVSVGDSVTTDHISPAGAIPAASPAGQYLVSKGVKPVDFNQYGTRRGNHEVLIRGTFANIRLRNKLVDKEGWWTRHIPSGDELTIYDATLRYQKEGVPLLVFAGKEYGSGSSRDWAAKGPNLMGVRAAIAESFERIHRSNLVMMGAIPLEFMPGESMASLGLTGQETFTIRGLDKLAPKAKLAVDAMSPDGKRRTFEVLSRVDDPTDLEYVRQGGILHQVLRERIAAS